MKLTFERTVLGLVVVALTLACLHFHKKTEEIRKDLTANTKPIPDTPDTPIPDILKESQLLHDHIDLARSDRQQIRTELDALAGFVASWDFTGDGAMRQLSLIETMLEARGESEKAKKVRDQMADLMGLKPEARDLWEKIHRE